MFILLSLPGTKTTMNIKLEKASGNTLSETHFQIRKLVFQDEQGIDVSLDVDKHDKHRKTHHYVLLLNDLPVGAVRWREGTMGYKIERFCILKEYRSQGLGMEMLKLIFSEIPTNQKVYLGAQDHARKFYEKGGFRIKGSPYWEGSILHHRMVVAKNDRRKVLDDIEGHQLRLKLT